MSFKTRRLSRGAAYVCAVLLIMLLGPRQGDWKLIWRTPLPSQLELFNIAQDPYEKTNVAEQNPQIVAQLQKRIEELARESAKSLFLVDAFSAAWGAAHGAPSLPTEDAFFNQHD